MIRQWPTVELFGNAHVLIPGILVTVCQSIINPNSPVTMIDNLSEGVTCHECLTTMQDLQVPTA